MGHWGTGIFSNDLACDIRNDYQDALLIGCTTEKAEDYIFSRYYNDIKDTEEETIFWLSLAWCEWKKGRLSQTVKSKALSILENGDDLIFWNDAKERKEREQALTKLKTTLLSPMPEIKKIRKPSIVKSPWLVGDLLAYKLSNPTIPFPEYLNKYVLLRILSIIKSPISNHPECQDYNDSVFIGLYNWINSEIPSNTSFLTQLKYITLKEMCIPLIGKRSENCVRLIFTKQDIKNKEMIVLDHESDVDYSKEFKFSLHSTMVSINSLECTIASALKKQTQLLG